MKTFDDTILQAIRAEADPLPPAVDRKISETLAHLSDGVI